MCLQDLAVVFLSVVCQDTECYYSRISRADTDGLCCSQATVILRLAALCAEKVCTELASVYETLGASERLRFLIRDTVHDITPEFANRAVEWLNQWL